MAVVPIYRIALTRAVKIGIVESGVAVGGQNGIAAESAADVALETFRSVASLKDEIVRLVLPSTVPGQSAFGFVRSLSANDGVRLDALTLVQSVIVLHSRRLPNSYIPRSSEGDISLDQIPEMTNTQLQQVLNASTAASSASLLPGVCLVRPRRLADEAERLLSGLLDLPVRGASATGTGVPISYSLLEHVMDSLVNIARQRPQFMDRIVQAFETVHVTLPPHFSDVQVSSVFEALHRTSEIPLNRDTSASFDATSAHGDVDMRQMRLDAVPSIGTPQSTVPCTAVTSAQTPSRSGQQSTQMNATPGSTQSRTPQTPTTESGDRGKSFADGFSFAQGSGGSAAVKRELPSIDLVTTQLVPRLTTANVADLVLLSMVTLPDQMPAAFQSTYTPIAAAGTSAQIRHLARLLAVQLVVWAGESSDADAAENISQLKSVLRNPAEDMADSRTVRHKRASKSELGGSADRQLAQDAFSRIIEGLEGSTARFPTAVNENQVIPLTGTESLPSSLHLNRMKLLTRLTMRRFGGNEFYKILIEYAIKNLKHGFELLSKLLMQEYCRFRGFQLVGFSAFLHSRRNQLSLLRARQNKSAENTDTVDSESGMELVSDQQQNVKQSNIEDTHEPTRDRDDGHDDLTAEPENDISEEGGESQSNQSVCRNIICVSDSSLKREEPGIEPEETGLKRSSGESKAEKSDNDKSGTKMESKGSVKPSTLTRDGKLGISKAPNVTPPDDLGCLSFYDCLLVDVLQRLKHPDIRQIYFGRFLIEAPLLTSGAISVLKRYCSNPTQAAYGFQSFATDILRKLTQPRPTPDIYPFTNHPVVPSKWNDESCQACAHLFLGLMPQSPSLMHKLAEVYVNAGPEVKRSVLRMIDQPIREIGIYSLDLHELVDRCPLGAETLITRMIHLLTDSPSAVAAAAAAAAAASTATANTPGAQKPGTPAAAISAPVSTPSALSTPAPVIMPPASLVDRVYRLYSERVHDVRCLIPILVGLSKQEVIAALPRLILLNEKVVKEVLTRLLNASVATQYAPRINTVRNMACTTAELLDAPLGPLKPEELLVAIHLLEFAKDPNDTTGHSTKPYIGLQDILHACRVCFAERRLFTQERLSMAIGQLLEQPVLPTLFMRTVMQALALHPRLAGYVINVLVRLIRKQVGRISHPPYLHICRAFGIEDQTSECHPLESSMEDDDLEPPILPATRLKSAPKRVPVWSRSSSDEVNTLGVSSEFLDTKEEQQKEAGNLATVALRQPKRPVDLDKLEADRVSFPALRVRC
ncbi:Symplekin [Fasciola gigantica]|uniref:Symplekin n=1 Tax=Fasciola gigantica TaxID=46835 RepID=A0A504Y5K3_FASGI|nr:Symplekin [Fasciola gigantica]